MGMRSEPGWFCAGISLLLHGQGSRDVVWEWGLWGRASRGSEGPRLCSELRGAGAVRGKVLLGFGAARGCPLVA